MSDMILAHKLQLIEAAENEAILKSTDYSIEIIANRDGVSIIYFDTSSIPTNGYNIFLFIINKRRNMMAFSIKKSRLRNYADFIESELDVLAQHLRIAGQDILSGSKDWIKTYSWPIIHPSRNITSII